MKHDFKSDFKNYQTRRCLEPNDRSAICLGRIQPNTARRTDTWGTYIGKMDGWTSKLVQNLISVAYTLTQRQINIRLIQAFTMGTSV